MPRRATRIIAKLVRRPVWQQYALDYGQVPRILSREWAVEGGMDGNALSRNGYR
jgi:hypothetical protein